MRLFFAAIALPSLCIHLTKVLATSSPRPEHPSAHSYILHEKRSHVPSGWTLVKRHDPSETIPLRFGLKQTNITKLEELLFDVSHPDSPNYGKHWTPEQVARAFAPSKESVEVVRTWLAERGINKERVKISRSRGWLQVNATVEEAETILKTQYHVYEHASGTRHIACKAYHLPEHVSPHVEIITPSIHFDAVLKKRGKNATLPSKRVGMPGTAFAPKTTGYIRNIHQELGDCHETITPLCLRALYDLTYEPLSPHKNSFAIVEYTPQAYLQSDLDMFHTNFSSHLVGKSPKLVSIDGGVVQDIQAGFEYNAESNLDLQYAMNLVNLLDAKQEVTLYQVGDIPQGATFNNLIDALDGTYCTFEGGDDLIEDAIYPDTYPNGYRSKPSPLFGFLSDSTGQKTLITKRTFKMRQIVGLRSLPMSFPPHTGTTKLIFPLFMLRGNVQSAYGTSYYELTSQLITKRRLSHMLFQPPFSLHDGTYRYAKLGLMGVTVIYSSGDNGVAGNAGVCLMPDGSETDYGSIFNPSFPSTCPYVTSVGATQINPGMKVTDQESACEQVIFSGGGFSNYFPMPKYQTRAVGNYLQNHKPEEYGPEVWNSTGNSRAYPDISANGANFAVAVGGRFSRIYGTSAAAPVIGAILTMINDARITIGKSPVGFINPVIYSERFSSALNDITSGKNDGCGTPGFAAIPGWDPVTGLGTPSFPKLLERWLDLP
ncbi:hypothetical protein D9613_011842 [Agrocybe pediades]|uniref:tripeptidyl-peptidase II n=1 Tax=Agrocybe pediades TaxID=84607 RepID=A0A8H4QM38_9AGAR|nr:hypothetical protein D9613_011842 [Agrocybe pediades]